MDNIEIRIDSIDNIKVRDLLLHHLSKMKQGSPKESVHALDLDDFRHLNVTLWSLWINKELAGCGALKELNEYHGELKSMRTHDYYLRKGVAQNLLEHIVNIAKQRGYTRISLETGSADSFKPAHKLYKKSGFVLCDPFANYIEDPNSIFMTKEI